MDASSLLLKADLNDSNNGASATAPNPITNGSVPALNVALSGIVNDYQFAHTGALSIAAGGEIHVDVTGGDVINLTRRPGPPSSTAARPTTHAS